MRHISYILSILTFLLLSYGTTFEVSAQNDEDTMEKLETYSEMFYMKQSDGNKKFTFELTFDGEEDTEGVPNAIVKFYTGFDEPEEIAEIPTNEQGKAVLQVAPDYQLPVDEGGYFYVKAIFEGNDKFEGSESEVTYIDAFLDVDLEESEGEKNIVVSMYHYDLEGEKVPISDEDIFLYVPRMFTRLNIGDGYLEEGSASISFPTDLPGDTEGNVTVIARLEDHGDFGTVEQKNSSNWALVKSNDYVKDHRALWTQIAPTWMIVTLTIMLIGVWGHYLYAVIQLFKIKKNV